MELNVEHLNKAKRAIDRTNARIGVAIRFSLAVGIMNDDIVYEVLMREYKTGIGKTLYRGRSLEAFMAVVDSCDKLALALTR